MELTAKILMAQRKEDLIRKILEKDKKVKEQQEEIQKKDLEIEKLRKQIDQLKTEGKRQAAPFRLSEKKLAKDKKPPGRRRGHKGHYRQLPAQIDEQIEVKLDGCPRCGSEVKDQRAIIQYIEEIPPIRPRVYQLTTWQGECEQCGPVQSTHPLKSSDAVGAARVQLGPRAQSMAVSLQYHYGLSKRKSCRIMKDYFGITFTAGGLVHAAHRMGKKCKKDYNKLINQLRDSSYLHADETSWYVGRPKYWLWVFCNHHATLYHIADNRARQTARHIMGDNYKGVLISDCLMIYDDLNDQQHKCYSHHLKAIGEAMESGSKKGSTVFLKTLRIILKAAMALKACKQELVEQTYLQRCAALENSVEQLLKTPLTNEAEIKIANRIRKQRDHLFTFLYHDQVEATNNLAERQLRPAVIARKVSCGNKTPKGSDTWQTLVSLITTNKQTQVDNIDYFTNKFIFTQS